MSEKPYKGAGHDVRDVAARTARKREAARAEPLREAVSRADDVRRASAYARARGVL